LGFHIRHLVSRNYPSGISGVGLLLLRLSIAAALLSRGTDTPILAGAALVVLGFLNPLSALLAAILAAVSPNPSMINAAICLSLLLIGPGAFSLDARLFSRREIVIPLPQSGYPNKVRSGDSK
jgi:hypothetical protein